MTKKITHKGEDYITLEIDSKEYEITGAAIEAVEKLLDAKVIPKLSRAEAAQKLVEMIREETDAPEILYCNLEKLLDRVESLIVDESPAVVITDMIAAERLASYAEMGIKTNDDRKIIDYVRGNIDKNEEKNIDKDHIECEKLIDSIIEQCNS